MWLIGNSYIFFFIQQNQHLQEQQHQIQQNHQNNQNNQHLQQIQPTAPVKMGRGKHADGKPRGRMTAYAFFVQTCREEHKKKHPEEQVVFAEFSRKCAERWKVSASENILIKNIIIAITYTPLNGARVKNYVSLAFCFQRKFKWIRF